MQGNSANKIAKTLCISPATIRRDRERVGYALQKAMAAGITSDVDAGKSNGRSDFGAEKSRGKG